jgi:hypothetical protein
VLLEICKIFQAWKFPGNFSFLESQQEISTDEISSLSLQEENLTKEFLKKAHNVVEYNEFNLKVNLRFSLFSNEKESRN